MCIESVYYFSENPVIPVSQMESFIPVEILFRWTYYLFPTEREQ